MRHRRPVRLLQPEDVGYPPADAVVNGRRVATAITLASSAHDVVLTAEAEAKDRESRDLLGRAAADCAALIGRLIAIQHRLEHPRPPEAA